MKKIIVNDLEQIEVDQLIWDIENSSDFYIYELDDSDKNTEVVNILVKIINKNNSYDW
ncbi:MAG: hypothetical protein HDR43_03120 [Mycoplasma sp.]|nr:hypothetical protein [Mycoplasma sp.]